MSDTLHPKNWVFLKVRMNVLFATLTLSQRYMHFDTIAADNFWKHCGQRWNCSWWAISPLATMFQLYLTIKLSFIAIFQVFITMFSKSSATELLNVGEGKKSSPTQQSWYRALQSWQQRYKAMRTIFKTKTDKIFEEGVKYDTCPSARETRVFFMHY